MIIEFTWFEAKREEIRVTLAWESIQIVNFEHDFLDIVDLRPLDKIAHLFFTTSPRTFVSKGVSLG